MRRGCRGNTLHKTYRLPPCSGGGSPRILARRKRGLTGSAISFRFRRSRRNGENGGCQCGGFRRRVEIFSAGKNTPRPLTAHKPQRTQNISPFIFSGKKKICPWLSGSTLTKSGTDHLPSTPRPYLPGHTLPNSALSSRTHTAELRGISG